MMHGPANVKYIHTYNACCAHCCAALCCCEVCRCTETHPDRGTIPLPCQSRNRRRSENSIFLREVSFAQYGKASTFGDETKKLKTLFNPMLAHFNPMLAHFPSRNAFLKVSQASLLGVSGNSTMQIKMSVEYWCAAIDRGDGGSGD